MVRIETGKNDLYTWCINNERGKQLLEEWVGVDINDNYIDMKKTAVQSNKKVKWKCKNKHTWETSIQKRVLYESNCPYNEYKKIEER